MKNNATAKSAKSTKTAKVAKIAKTDKVAKVTKPTKGYTATTAEFATKLGISYAAAVNTLSSLKTLGLVKEVSRIRGRGRPTSIYQIHGTVANALEKVAAG